MVAGAAQVRSASPVPLYYQIMQQIIGSIDTGQLAEGEQLPTEGALCASYGVSRISIRKAVSELLTAGYIGRVRPRGRLVVLPKKLPQNITRFVGLFTYGAISAGKRPMTKVISVSREIAGGLGKPLLLSEQSRIYRVERVHYADGEPTSYEVCYLPEQLYPGLETFDLSQSLVDLIEKEYRLTFHHARQWVAAALSGDEQARHLKIQKGHPILSIRRTSFTSDGIPLEHFVSAFHPDRYELFMELQREES